MSDIFDFGFTAVTEDELASVEISKKIADESVATAEQLEDKLNKLYNAILPLLSNLKANPEKDYIYWPNRVAKVEAFEDHITNIIKD